MARLNTETYRVRHKLGNFHIFISQHQDNVYFATFLYREKSGTWSKDDEVSVELKAANFSGNSKDTVLEECQDWINQHLGTEYTIDQN
ncbi:MAG TPA: hypothetical protein VFS21_06520 [Roseiflexaceae bacterium]|nr:hypothetical protein [Roseiflexaceae bacterium]